MRAAAAVAMDAHVPLMAVLAGRSLSCDEGSELIEAACEGMGRQVADVLFELREAGGDMSEA